MFVHSDARPNGARWPAPTGPPLPAPTESATVPGARRLPRSVKFVIAGGFGVGKTTLVSTLSEIPPVSTEALMTTVASGIDDRRGVEAKVTTTVALDFGRITIDPSLVIYLFGTPGQERFNFMWDDITNGALGAIVLVDVARIEDGFAAITYFEQRGIPFVAAVNRFPGRPWYGLHEIAASLNVDPQVPVLECDARARNSAKAILIALLEYRISLIQGQSATSPSVAR